MTALKAYIKKYFGFTTGTSTWLFCNELHMYKVLPCQSDISVSHHPSCYQCHVSINITPIIVSTSHLSPHAISPSSYKPMSL